MESRKKEMIGYNMRRILGLGVIFMSCACFTYGQIDMDRFRVWAGYNLSNSGANHFNKLIDGYNMHNAGLTITEPLPSLNFSHGIVAGVGYEIQDGFTLHAIVKNRRQFLETQYTSSNLYYQFVFRQTTAEIGLTMELGEEKGFSHFVGGGLVVGDMGVNYAWSTEQGYRGLRNTRNIDHAGVLGVSISYEARFKVHELASIFIRPVGQFALGSEVRRLNAFMGPQWEDGQVKYNAVSPDKYNRGALNGLGLEAGLVFDLPALPK